MLKPYFPDFRKVQFSHGSTRPVTSAVYGTSCTAGTGGFGSWVTVGAALAYNTYALQIAINSVAVSGASRPLVLDIGIDVAGGSSFTTLIPSLLCGGRGPADGTITPAYYFPVFIPAGATIGIRAYGSVASVPYVSWRAYQAPTNPETVCAGKVVEAVGIGTTQGVAVTAGTTSDGAWTSLGTTVRECGFWQVGVQVGSADTSWNGAGYFLDLGYGDGTNIIQIIEGYSFILDNAELLRARMMLYQGYCKVPSGSTIYARAQCSESSVDPLTVAAYGVAA